MNKGILKKLSHLTAAILLSSQMVMPVSQAALGIATARLDFMVIGGIVALVGAGSTVYTVDSVRCGPRRYRGRHRHRPRPICTHVHVGYRYGSLAVTALGLLILDNDSQSASLTAVSDEQAWDLDLSPEEHAAFNSELPLVNAYLQTWSAEQAQKNSTDWNTQEGSSITWDSKDDSDLATINVNTEWNKDKASNVADLLSNETKSALSKMLAVVSQ